MIKLVRICGACEKEIVQGNGLYPHLCDECAEKQAHLELIRTRISNLESNFKPFIHEGRPHVKCPVCGSRAEVFGGTVKMIQCEFCGMFARRIDEIHHFKIYFYENEEWVEFHYERDVTWGSVWDIFEKIDQERKKQESIILDYKERLKKLGL